jgi:predicted ATPase
MLTKLTLKNFKNFQDAEVTLGPLTVLIGANASGKSNIRDAFRFLHGISRGYNLAEILGEKWGEGGVLQWRGIRGGLREVAFHGEYPLSIGVVSQVPLELHNGRVASELKYEIEIGLPEARPPLRILKESLRTESKPIFQSEEPRPLSWGVPHRLAPVLYQYAEEQALKPDEKQYVQRMLSLLSPCRFLELDPEAMRRPSYPGQTILGDRGENLSSVLQHICENPLAKAAFLAWVNDLTPLDVTDLDFVPDQTGRILVTFVEEDGRHTSAYSASDGTLRFLGMLAALLGPERATFYFIEELENGIHPSRLHLLINLLEQQVTKGKIQVVATSHSPLLLSFLSSQSLEYASLVYRSPDQSSAHVKRILDLPRAKELIEKQGITRLHTSHWFEDAAFFTEHAGVEE